MLIMDELTLGRKLYAFREDRKLSQTKLEVEVGLSFGTISRIENGVINPTKETIYKISSFLGLDCSEFNYLIGFNTIYPSTTDVNHVINKSQRNLTETGFPSYIIDSKFRIWQWNKMILDLFNISETQANKLLGQSHTRFVFSPEFGIIDKVPKDKLDEVIRQYVWRYRKVINKCRFESTIIEEINHLKSNNLFYKAWQEFERYDKDISFGDDFYYNYEGKMLSILVNMNELQFDNRFILVRYYPKDHKTSLVFEKLRKRVE